MKKGRTATFDFFGIVLEFVLLLDRFVPVVCTL